MTRREIALCSCVKGEDVTTADPSCGECGGDGEVYVGERPACCEGMDEGAPCWRDAEEGQRFCRFCEDDRREAAREDYWDGVREDRKLGI